MPFPFGKDIAYKFYALSDEKVYETLPSAPDGVYVYKEDYKPSAEDARAGTDNGGLLSTITTWADISDDAANLHGKQITIPAIDDPDPNGELRERTFWVAVVYKLQTGEQPQCAIRALPMRRVTSHHFSAAVTPGDLDSAYPFVDDLVSSAVMTSNITLATTLVQEKLSAKGFEWSQLWRPDQLETAITYKALSQIMLNLIVDTGDQWETRYKEFKKVADNTLSAIKVKYDTDENGEPDKVERFGRFGRIVR